MNAAFIAALLILGTLTLDAIVLWDELSIHFQCNDDGDCGDPTRCGCFPHRGDFPGKWC
ncbi:unnamed protein product, partial [Ixodes pacificus]